MEDERLKTLRSQTDLSLDQWQSYLDSYAKWMRNNPEEDRDGHQKKQETSGKILLEKDFLETATSQDFKQKINEYVSSLDGAVARTLSKRGGIDKDELYASLRQALIDLSEVGHDGFDEMIDNLLNGSHKKKLGNVGKAFWTPLFHLKFSDYPANWNEKTNKFFQSCGISLSTSKRTVAQNYLTLAKIYKELMLLRRELTSYEIDHMMHYGTEIDEGRAKLVALKISKNILNDITEKYISYVNNRDDGGLEFHVQDEGYKLESIDTFQKNFDIDAENIYEMLDRSLPKNNLTISANYRPRSMILRYAELYPNDVKDALKILFDQTNNLAKRISEYQNKIKELNERRDKDINHQGKPNSSYSDTRFVSLLLSCRYPEEYSYYKHKQLDAVLKFFGITIKLKSENDAFKIIISSEMGKKLARALSDNNQAQEIKAALTRNTDFKDDSSLWLAQDVVYCADRFIKSETKTNHTNFWIFQGNPDLFNIEEYLSRNVGKKIDWSANQFSERMALGDLVYIWSSKDGGLCGIGVICSKPIKRTSNDDNFRLGDKKVDLELLSYFSTDNRIKRQDLQDNPVLSKSQIVKQPQGSNFSLTTEEAFEIQKLIAYKGIVNVWLYSPGIENEYLEDTKKGLGVRLGWDELGDLNNYQNREEIKDELMKKYSLESENPYNLVSALDDIKETMKNGDIVILKKGTHGLKSIGHIISDYRYDKSLKMFKHQRKAIFSKYGEWRYDQNREPYLNDPAKQLPVKTLTQIGIYRDFTQRIINSMSNMALDKPKEIPMLKSLNTILYGPPGTGKTYRSKQLAQPFSKQSRSKEKRRIDVIDDFVTEATLHDVIAFTLAYLFDDRQSVSVTDLLASELIRSRFDTTRPKKERSAIWGRLQIHASDECPNVNHTKRNAPQYFWKEEDSTWRLVDDEAKQEILEKYADVTERLDRLSNDGVDEEANFVDFITFHQSYSYEEFVEGIRPDTNNEEESDGTLRYVMKDGVFKQVCKKAEQDPDNKYLLIIDEINRGNISKIFGELITLLEPNKRLGSDEELIVTLPYSQKQFGVPSNVYVLGTMNTADRSIALLDVALRRRFDFVELMPDYTQVDFEVEGVHVGKLLKTINSKVEIMTNRDYQIGHSYLMNAKTLDGLHEAWYNRVLPLLQEYFYNDWDKLKDIVHEYSEKKQTGFIELQSSKEIQNLFREETEYSDTAVGSIKDYSKEALPNALRALYETESVNKSI